MAAKFFMALPGILLWLLLAMGYALYLPGQSGMFNFDDSVNLRGLADVHDSWTALVFIATGESSLLSRPVALASFIFNLSDWPSHPQGFLYLNILIHLLNGALLYWFVLRLVRLAQPVLLQRAEWIAISTAALWLLSPLLASTSLIIVQRMTSLCTTFVLTGLLVYLAGLSWEVSGRAKLGLGLQASGIALGTLLAVLTKENGILLSLYALVLEKTILSNAVKMSTSLRWRTWLLAAPPVLLLAYIALTWQDMRAVYATRDFSPSERLMTEAVILWDYLRLAAVPRPVAFSPFNDDYPIVRSLLEQPWALIALLGWLTIIALAFRKRKNWPLFALAVFWYLGGHSLESTVVPLELYFEHRNYLPLIGPILALSWFFWTPHLVGSLYRLAPIVLGGYVVLLAALLWQLTTLWGQPLIAAEVWARQHLHSPRAIHFLATSYLALEKPETARQVLERAAYAHPTTIGLSLQALLLACTYGNINETRSLFRMTQENAIQGKYSAATVNSLRRIREMLSRGECPGLSRADLYNLIDQLMINPLYISNGRRLSGLHYLKSELYRDERNLDATLNHLEAAYQAEPDIGAAVLIVSTMLSAGLNEQAQVFLDQIGKDLPMNPVLRIEWLKIVNQLRAQIN